MIHDHASSWNNYYITYIIKGILLIDSSCSIENNTCHNLYHIPINRRLQYHPEGRMPGGWNWWRVEIRWDTVFDMFWCFYYIFEFKNLVFIFTLKKITRYYFITIFKQRIFDVQMYCDVIFSRNVQIMTL